ncbi:hypothetical protein [Parerythrobacter jejuensis]|uniref:Lipoprotein n=1 Tax=Parerythrobacter jejuensis TaxID=795812 RepID=A0A845ANT3_9SPHN|nr:hypothetical protein [Parerythrobacter jejuensis]MXP32472.1 hypothetical protein [Parerythrobacter jejuensis]
MKKLIAIASLAALGACSQSEPSTGADPTEVVVPQPSVTAGTYEATNAEGAVNRAVLAEDGTYATYGADGSATGSGSWTNVGRRTCFDPEGDTTEVCYTDGTPAEDGTFTATSDDGNVISVRPVEGDIATE